jgi:excinuclease ABC subunit C
MKPLTNGIEIIKSYQKTLSDRPGVYRMVNDDKKVLYVGKAKNLSKRVASYTRPDKLPMRLKRMIAETTAMEFVETHTELEALLLEFNLIKELRPVYNVMMTDDKAYPYIYMNTEHDFPRAMKYRGAKKMKGEYYGPFASAGAVNKTLITLQKVFQIRNCSDHYFNNRSRPCLQYHIKQCTAPCVGKVSKEDYQSQVRQASNFLEGKGDDIQGELAERMKEASERTDYEMAATYRDRIHALRALQASQIINLENVKHADIFAVAVEAGFICISVFFIRNGQNFGNQTHFPKVGEDEKPSDILLEFMIEFYTKHPVMPCIFTNILPSECDMLAEALSIQAERKVSITKPTRGERRQVVTMAEQNAQSALIRHKERKTSDSDGLKRVKAIFELDEIPQRIEVYDNSHTGGEHMLGAMIVATPDGFQKSQYRKFNLKDTEASDDYGGMREVMKRRFARALEEDRGKNHETWPDIILIDGGKGQLSSVTEILEELNILDDVTLVSIAKGPDRNAGREDFYMNGRTPFRLPPNDVGLFYLQRLRDEAHRFAIGSMRIRRAKTIEKSPLDDVPGIGPKRKKALLTYFGSGKAVARASLSDLQKVEGISKAFAEKIYGFFHG